MTGKEGVPPHGRFTGSRAFTRVHDPTRNTCKEPQIGMFGRDGRDATEVELMDGKWTEACSQVCCAFPVGLTSARAV